MWAFLQTYGIWILLGIFVFLMFRMHSGGMHGGMGGGCGMGMDHERYDQHEQQSQTQVVPLRGRNTTSSGVIPLDNEATYPQDNPSGVDSGQENTLSKNYPVGHHHH